MSLFKIIADFIIPPKCLFCGAALSNGTRPLICEKCKTSHGTSNTLCCRCGSEFEYRNGLPYCNTCRSCRHPFDGVVSCFFYSDGVRRAVVEHKFNFEYNNSSTFSRVVSDKIKNVFIDKLPDIIIPVPSSRKRTFQRGYDPLVEIAEEISLLTDIPLITKAVIKHKDIPQQSTLSSFRQRLRNVRGCFRVENKNLIKGKTVLLFDDVYTTGATTRECAKVLKRGGAAYIIIVTLAISENFRR